MESPGIDKRLLEIINAHDGVSRKKLAELTGLSQATITKVSKRLLSNQLIVEGERVSSGLGRREVLLIPNPEKYRYLSIDVGGYYVRVAVGDSNMGIIDQTQFPMSDLTQADDILDGLEANIAAFIGGPLNRGQAIDAIGVGVTGIVDRRRERILSIPNAARWTDVNLVSRLQERFHCSVFLDEGGRTMAMAEKLKGKARDVDNFMLVHVGFGVVAGVYLHGQPLRGANNVAGLLGHVTVDETAGRCTCGNYGCLENVITFPMLEKEYAGRGGDAPSIVDAYRVNDKTALDVCIWAGNLLGIALSNAVNLLNPEVVYLGGAMFELMPLLLEETRRTVVLRANRYATLDLHLTETTYGLNQGLMGGLALCSAELARRV